MEALPESGKAEDLVLGKGYLANVTKVIDHDVSCKQENDTDVFPYTSWIQDDA